MHPARVRDLKHLCLQIRHSLDRRARLARVHALQAPAPLRMPAAAHFPTMRMTYLLCILPLRTRQYIGIIVHDIVQTKAALATN